MGPTQSNFAKLPVVPLNNLIHNNSIIGTYTENLNRVLGTNDKVSTISAACNQPPCDQPRSAEITEHVGGVAVIIRYT